MRWWSGSCRSRATWLAGTGAVANLWRTSSRSRASHWSERSRRSTRRATWRSAPTRFRASLVSSSVTTVTAAGRCAFRAISRSLRCASSGSTRQRPSAAACPRRWRRSPSRPGVSVEEVIEAREAYQALYADSLDQPRRSSDTDERSVSLLETMGTRDTGFENAFDRVLLDSLLETLEERDRAIVRLYHQEGAHAGRDRRPPRLFADAHLATAPPCHCRAGGGRGTAERPHRALRCLTRSARWPPGQQRCRLGGSPVTRRCRVRATYARAW